MTAYRFCMTLVVCLVQVVLANPNDVAPTSIRADDSISKQEQVVLHGRVQDAVTDTLEVRLTRTVIELADEVVIYAERAASARAHPTGQVKSTIAAIAAIDGVGLVRRANFALDPAIRGTHPGQVAVVIEGMKIFHACVDRMDPVTSYVETENLQRLEVSRGGFDLTQGSMVGGVVNLVTEKPSFAHALSGHSQIGFETVSGHRFSRNVINFSQGNLATRGSFSYRKAGDMAAGGGDIINNTQFAKYNYKLDLTRKSERHQLDASVLIDEAWDIGYPALLMDATRARSRLYSLVHTWKPNYGRLHSVQTKFYLSRVDHWMDDEQRDVSQREVMRDMHMPMFGRTRTWGLLHTLQFGAREQTLKVIVDAYQTTAFADMEMISVFADVAPMYLLNLGDVERRHAALTTDYQRILSPRLQARVNLRVDVADQDLFDPIARRQLAATWGETSLDRRFGTFSTSVALDYAWRNDTHLTLAWADNARLPTPLESYGFFLFNPTDGYFYTGKPQLRPERSRQVEFGIDYESQGRRLRLRVYDNRMTDYITGVVQESIFKSYQNIALARIRGAEVSAQLPLRAAAQLQASVTYIRGYNDVFDEPLPFIPPVEGRVAVDYQTGRLWMEGGVRLAARQARIARRTTLEDETPAFAVVDGRVATDLTRRYRLEIGVENLFDHYYHEHLSVGNFPNPGRNLRMSIDLGF